VTIETIRKLKFELLPHSAYSPDLTPSDYHIFGPIKDVLRVYQFSNDEEIKIVMHTLLRAQPKTFFKMAPESSWTEVTNMCGETRELSRKMTV
jgi:histone-lysine N-methyltransferase SETMAR